MTGKITLSIEIELAWGHHDQQTNHSLLSNRRKIETETLKRLLACCDEYQIPITFDIVGHLLETSCEGTHDGPHETGWFGADPGTDVDSDPLFYAPDLVRMIRTAKVDHEICTHSYSHVLGDTADPAVIEWELRTVDALWERHGLKKTRVIHPPKA